MAIGVTSLTTGKYRIEARSGDTIILTDQELHDLYAWIVVHKGHSKIIELLEEALSIDGVRHKQWYLWHLAEALGLELPDDLVDKGIAP